jgi:hypothetical protein
VQDTPLVGVVDGPGDSGDQGRRRRLPLPGVRASGRAGDGQVGHPGGEASALHQPHGKEVPTLMLADLVDGHDVRVVEGRGGLGLLFEPPDRRRRGKLTGPDHLEGDDPVQAQLPGLVTTPMAPAATTPRSS